MNVYDHNGSIISLADHALASGAEGAVYSIQGHPRKLVKVYTNSSDAMAREDKIREMVGVFQSGALHRSGLYNDASWPQARIFDMNHKFIGFGMNAVGNGHKLDDVYAYPPKPDIKVTMYDKITMLISLCDIISKCHATGTIIGDSNPENIMINDDMTVSFIDADSWHVHIGGKTYKCVVCAPGYVAPELVTKVKNTSYEAYNGETFTKETDYFGLAVHIFKMLMNGCHPFNVVKHATVGSGVSIKPIDMRVERGETPFFRTLPGLTVPDWVPKLNDLPVYITSLFKRAFVDGHRNPSARPTEKEWRAALVKYKSELVKCSSQRMHYYWKGLNHCPYCATAKATPIPQPRPQVKTSGNVVNNLKNTVASTASGIVNHPNGVGVKSGGNNHHNFASTNSVDDTNNYIFWAITLLLMTGLQAYLLFSGVYEQQFVQLFEEATWVAGIISWLTAAAGVIGTCVYNSIWSNYAKGGRINIEDYCVSLICGVGFTVGGAIALVIAAYLIYLAFMIFMYGLIIAVIFSIFAGLCSG